VEGGNRGRDGKERRRLEEEGWVRGRRELEGRREQLMTIQRLLGVCC